MILANQRWDKNRKLVLLVDSDVEILTPKYDGISKQRLRQIPHEWDWCLYKKRHKSLPPLSSLCYMRIQGKDGHLQARE